MRHIQLYPAVHDMCAAARGVVKASRHVPAQHTQASDLHLPTCLPSRARALSVASAGALAQRSPAQAVSRVRHDELGVIGVALEDVVDDGAWLERKDMSLHFQS